MKKFIFALMVCAVTMSSFALGKTKVKRVESSAITDLDGYWNDTDVRIVCDSLIDECVNSPRIAKFEEENGRPGLVIVGKIVNDCDEKIDTQLLKRSCVLQLLIPVFWNLLFQKMNVLSSVMRKWIRNSMQALILQSPWITKQVQTLC